MPVKKWSKAVTEHSDALDLEENVFESHDAKKIAKSLKKSAEKSDRKKSSPYKSAINMLTFYINRAGKNLPASQKKGLENAKEELRKLFGREENDKAPKKAKAAKKATAVKKIKTVKKATAVKTAKATSKKAKTK